MGQKLSNNGNALLAGNITAIATSLTVQSSKADSFPVANTSDWLTPVDWFRATIEDDSGNIEIIKVGTRASGSGVFSVILRGQEGTTPFAFNAGAVVEQRFTALDHERMLAGDFENLIVDTKITQGGVDGRVTPVGGVILYSGAIAAIPAGWQLCDGTNGTPNLRDRFIVGAGTGYAVGATGGSVDATLVSHTHTASFTGSVLAAHAHVVTDPGHFHDFASFVATGGDQLASNAAGANSKNNSTTSVGTGITVASASAGTPAGTVAVSTNGASATGANLPPYYALAYIMCMGF